MKDPLNCLKLLKDALDKAFDHFKNKQQVFEVMFFDM